MDQILTKKKKKTQKKKKKKKTHKKTTTTTTKKKKQQKKKKRNAVEAMIREAKNDTPKIICNTKGKYKQLQNSVETRAGMGTKRAMESTSILILYNYH